MRKKLSVLLLMVMICSLAFTGCGKGGSDDGKKKTVGNIKVYVPEGWETDTAHSGKNTDDDSIFLKKDGLDTEYIWIRATDKDGAKAEIKKNIKDEIDDFETDDIEWEGKENLVMAKVKDTYFVAFVYGLTFEDDDVVEIMSSLKYTGDKADNDNGSDENNVAGADVDVDDDNDNSDDEDDMPAGIYEADADDNSANDGADDGDNGAATGIDYKAKYDGTWYGYMYFDKCTGSFAGSADSWFNCYLVINMNDDGTGTYEVYNTWDKVCAGTLKAEGDELHCLTGEIFGLSIQKENWIFRPAPKLDTAMGMIDLIKPNDTDALDYCIYVKPWGVSWGEIDYAEIYKNVLYENDAKVLAGEEPPVGFTNPTYFKK